MNLNSYQKIILFASYFSVLAPLTVYVISIKKVRAEIHSIGVLVIVSGVCDLIGYNLVKQRFSTAFINNAFFLFQFFLLSHYYYKTVFLNKQNRVLVITMAQYVLGLIIVTFFYDSFGEQHQNSMWAASSAVLIVYSILHFKKILKAHQSPHIYRSGYFWINNGVLFYLLTSLWLFAFTSDALMTSLEPKVAQFLWRFYNINNVIKNILFASGIYYSSKELQRIPEL